EKPRIVVLFYSLPSKSGFRIRSNNLVNLCLYSHPDYKIPIFESTVAPTNNKWKYISIDFKTDSIFYMEVSPLNGNSVIDFDRIDFNHDTFLPVQFNKISKHIVSYCGSSINKTFTANSPNKYLPNGIDNFLDSSSLELNSEKQQYVRLEHNILKGLDAFTISTWIYSKNLNTWERIFDFGSGISKYMFLTPSNRKNLPQFALKKSEESGEQIVESKISLSVNTWHHIAITLSNNIATIYIDGIKAGENTKMTVPFDLGETTNNYIGKSQYIRDPYFSGFLSNFTVYDKALSPEDINRLFTYGRRSSKEINNTLFKLNKSFIDSGQEKVTYSIYNLPSGAHFNTQTGELTWKPSLNQVGDYKLYVTAETDNSIDTQILSIHIAENKQNAIDYILKKYYDQNEKYSSSSINRLKTAIKLNDLNNLVDAATNLSLLTPRLSDNSIDYPKISTSNIKNINLLTDNNTFTWSGIWGRDDKNIVFDFGNDFKIKTTSFAIQCRDGFPIRASDVTVWGSNDSIKWIPLTENSTTKSSEMQYLKTKEEEKNNAYRYIRFLMPAKTYHIFEISELRIWGERIENLNTDKNDTYKK
ncbi:MAG TPA: putative Ig domain-containing protein, partial [Victivallales bacterium]|nr:putative Ig domain-containing protein [Victivallales bacterium]